MIAFNHTSIKQYKGKMIKLTWTKKGETHSVTGEITAATRQSILFRVNKSSELEIRLNYDQLNEITNPK